MLAIVTSAWSGYQLQTDEVEELRGEVSSLQQQVADISRELSPRSEFGLSINEFRTLRAFLFVEEASRTETCGSFFAAPRSLYLSDDLNPESRRYYVSSFQGRFPFTEGRQDSCVYEYLFFSVPVADEYYITDALFLGGVVTGGSWTLDAEDGVDYMEFSLEY